MNATGSMQMQAPQGYNTFQKYTPEQMQLYNQQYAHVSPNSFTAKLAAGDQGAFEQTEAPAMRQFSELQGNTASRFSGMGGLGGRKSSGFQNYMGQQGMDFASQLRSQRMSLQNQAIQDMMSMSGQLLGQTPYGLQEQPKKKKGFWEQIAGVGLPLAGAAGGFLFGGPSGALAGAQAGSSAAQSFYA